MTILLVFMYLDDHGALAHLDKLEQTAIGTALLFFGWLIVYLVKKLVFLANHHSSQLKEVVISNTSAIVKLESTLDRNTDVTERLERKLT